MTYEVGKFVRLTKSIYDDGEDHHPPSLIAQKGDLVKIKEIRSYGVMAVHHEDVTDGRAFMVYSGEYCPTILKE